MIGVLAHAGDAPGIAVAVPQVPLTSSVENS